MNWVQVRGGKAGRGGLGRAGRTAKPAGQLIPRMELRSSLAVLVLYLTLPWPCLLTIAFSPEPRITVSYRTLQGEIGYFRKADNLSTLLLDRTRDRLYVGGRDAIFALSVQNVEHEVKPKIRWQASQTTVTDCEKKGKRSDDCANFVKFLQFFNDTHIYTCGTYAFKPSCMFIVSTFCANLRCKLVYIVII
uniref:semaphorin-4G-like isoform X1 n=2 Tax=Myxine glutinosa TaxID=7769 RepID=UPI00358E7A97